MYIDSNQKNYIFVQDRPMLLKDYFRFRVAFIVITPDYSVPFTYLLAEQILDSLRFVSKDLNFSIL